jgi:hypothetical protein
LIACFDTWGPHAIRFVFTVVTGALSGVVLGFAARFASLFLPHLHREFVIAGAFFTHHFLFTVLEVRYLR